MRVAEERGSFIGEEVGYSVRFDNCFDHKATRIKVSTLTLIENTLVSWFAAYSLV